MQKFTVDRASNGLNTMIIRLLLVLCCTPGLLASSASLAASLPEHSAIAILIIADEVNPHRLSDADLTQPQDLVPAITAADSPLHTRHVEIINSQCADQALAVLRAASPPDVVLYFAHRAARNRDGSDAQTELTRLLESGLHSGLGVVVLHHGLYVDIFNKGAKDELLALIGAQTNSINWDTEQGQRVFNVGGNHFVSSNGLTYAPDAAFAGTGNVAAGIYPYFVNLSDELYSDTALLEEAGETRLMRHCQIKVVDRGRADHRQSVAGHRPVGQTHILPCQIGARQHGPYPFERRVGEGQRGFTDFCRIVALVAGRCGGQQTPGRILAQFLFGTGKDMADERGHRPRQAEAEQHREQSSCAELG